MSRKRKKISSSKKRLLDAPEGDTKMPLVEHLRELRRRVVIVFLSWLAATCFAYLFIEDIYSFLVAPLAEAYGEGSYRRLIFTGLTEAFFTYLRLAVYTGFAVAFPVIAYQFYAFVAPGMYKQEKLVLLPFLVGAPALFIAGGALAYYLIFPMAWEFFLSFESSTIGEGSTILPIQLEARVSEYLSIVTQLMIGFGLAFQLPILIMLLVVTGFASVSGLKKQRKYVILGVFIVAAFLTPPDVFSQFAMAIPMLILFELALIASTYLETNKKKNARHQMDTQKS